MSAPRIALMIGGAHKAGTTALFRALTRHPRLAGHAQSELTFFVEDEEFARGHDSRAWRRYLPRGRDALFVAKHAKLMYRRAALERLRAHAPEAWLVLVLRHPAERAHSAYWHARALGREELPSFEAALAAEEDRLRAGRAPWHDTAYVQNGLYADGLVQARAALGRERVLVFLLEDLRADFASVCRALLAHLGVEPDVRAEPARENRATRARSEPLARVLARAFESRAPLKRALRAALPDRLAVALREGLVRWNSRPLEVPPMAADTRAALCARFAEPNARLAAELGRELSGWER